MMKYMIDDFKRFLLVAFVSLPFGLFIYIPITIFLRINCFITHPRGAEGRHGDYFSFACWRCLEIGEKNRVYDFFCPWYRNNSGLSTGEEDNNWLKPEMLWHRNRSEKH